LTGATIKLYITGKNDTSNDGNDWYVLVPTTPANIPPTTTDFGRVGTIELSNRIFTSTIAPGSYTTFTLNTAGLATVIKGGTTIIALREGHDLLNVPVISPSGNKITVAFSEAGVTQAPTLDIHYTVSPPPPDTTPPVLSNGSPTGQLPSGTTRATLSLSTNENVTCKYGTTANVGYASIPSTFSTTGSISHNAAISGLINGQSYAYYVRCQDQAGNSNTNDYPISFSVASAPTVDSIPPSTPTNLAVTAISTTQINLVWSNSTDNVGVTGYKIYRCQGLCTPSSQLATSPSASYQDTGLTPNTTYTYTVVAYDASGNVSNQSVSASTTTQVLPPSYTPSQEGAGAMVATLARLNNGTLLDVPFGGSVSPPYWVTNRSFTSLDFSAAIDVAPGTGNTLQFVIKYATLSPTQNCTDIPSGNWITANLGVLSSTQKSFTVSDVPVNVIGPACIAGHILRTASYAVTHGTASLHPHDSAGDGPTYYQGSASTANSLGQLYLGNWHTTTNHNRSFWIAGSAIRNVGGVLALNVPPGPGNTWHVQIAHSQTPLSPSQNCLDLSYNTTADVATITGTQKTASWDTVLIDAPAGGCIQIRATWTGGVPLSTAPANYGLTVSGSNSTPYNDGGPSYSNVGSGAFDSSHIFGVGPWAISDATPQNGNAFISQQYWRAPTTGLVGLSGAFTFTSPTVGTGQFDIGIRTSLTAPTVNQSCLDLQYVDSAPLCVMRSGDKSCSFPVSTFNIPANACFGLEVKTSGGTPSNTGPFNWQATGVANSGGPTDTTSPTIGSLQASPAGPYASPQTVTLSVTASDNIGVSRVEFYDGATLAGTDTSAPYQYSWSITSSSQNGTHSWTAKAFDAAGNNVTSGALPLTVNISTSDITPPTIPTSLTAIAISFSQITLNWNASTDNVAVTGYRLDVATNNTFTNLVLGYQNLDVGNVLTKAITGLSPLTTYYLRLRAYDATGSVSGQSASVSAITLSAGPPPDLTPPTISNIILSLITTSSVRISWVTSEQAQAKIDYGFTATYGQTTSLTPLNTSHEFNLTNLSANMFYHFRITATDAVGNQSFSSDQTFRTLPTILPDITPPAAITDLSANTITQTSIDLSWTAPGDDGITGIATLYDLRYSTTTITPITFASATFLLGEPTPQSAGSRQTYTIIGLFPDTTYSVALMTTDEVTNVSPLSNVIQGTTASSPTTGGGPPSGGGGPSTGGGGGGGGPIYDTTPPAQPSGLSISTGDKQLTLRWKNPTDPDFVRVMIVRKEGSHPTSRMDGQAVYDGTAQEFTDIHLDNTKTYYYAIFAYDRVPNYTSLLSISAKPEAGKTSISFVNPVSTQPQSTSTIPGITITKWLSLRINDPQVRLLQEYLNKIGYTISAQGPGSRGQETTFFGPGTEKALRQFQCQKIRVCQGSPSTSGYGGTGPRTRAALSQGGSGTANTPSAEFPLQRLLRLLELLRSLQERLRLVEGR
jgi:chitodextrinase